jgi:hypothetical protein
MNCSLKRFYKLKDEIKKGEKDVHRDYTSHCSDEAAKERSAEDNIQKSKANKSQEESETTSLGSSRSIRSHTLSGASIHLKGNDCGGRNGDSIGVLRWPVWVCVHNSRYRLAHNER